MTQVKEMTNPELDCKLAAVMNYIPLSNACDDYHKRYGSIPCWSSDPAASLEVQAKAMSKDDVAYIRNLVDITCGIDSGIIADTRIGLGIIPKLLTATPRERAEAAYQTLSGEQ